MNIESKTTIKVKNYGDMFAQVHGMELISYEEDGGYQGDYLVVLKNGDRLFYYTGYYGSCSGCDWLEAEKDWGTDEVDYKKALEFCNVKPRYIVPIDMPLKFEKERYEGFKLVNSSTDM